MVRLVTDYGRESSWREKLYPLFEEVFGMPVDLLQDFHRRGYWDPSYCPYTYFDGDRALANVSRFSLPLIIKGQPIVAAGIQSVMTLPEFRHLGLMTSLMEYMLEDIDRRYFVSLLFTSQPNLYQRFGFQKVPETRFRAALPCLALDTPSALRRLDLSKHADGVLLQRVLEQSVPLSHGFAPTSYQSSFYLHCYETAWRERLHYDPESESVIVYEAHEKTLWLYAILAKEWPTMQSVLRAVATASLTEVVVDFSPDRFPELAWTPFLCESASILMARGEILLPQPLTYPDIAKF